MKKMGAQMFLSKKKQTQLLKVIQSLHGSLDDYEIRKQSGYLLLDLLEAECVASFIWNHEQKSFDKGVFINRDPQTMINHNDVLTPNGLYYGVSLDTGDRSNHIGYFRVWPRRGKKSFDEKTLYLLDLIRPHFCNAILNSQSYQTCHLASKQVIMNLSGKTDLSSASTTISREQLMRDFSLTKREADTTLQLLQGHRDELIAQNLHIAFSTLRTHLRNIFSKTNVSSRAALIHRVYSQL
ncbi:helix-turn-helix transcriptional regulator [Thiothrix lacustris]|uniref:helix-turn-helix transcriptional regulator n=1 Tax=Thiothrix lacustris TaxID=525917 RepID=UPI0027E468B6|nr:helix-turn-helix transcriptional regulator [Thiothrix lacustris]WMP19235.1 helix-turn-helix transcriptional regulator [Thiothrix lacustris]